MQQHGCMRRASVGGVWGMWKGSRGEPCRGFAGHKPVHRVSCEAVRSVCNNGMWCVGRVVSSARVW